MVSQNGNLSIFKTDSSFVRQLTSNNTDSNPEWSVQDKIAYNSSVNGNNDIFVINPDGTGNEQITTDQASDSLPTWSPDGTRIAFISDNHIEGYFESQKLNKPI